MLKPCKTQGYYCTKCKTRYALWGNVKKECWEGKCTEKEE